MIERNRIKCTNFLNVFPLKSGNKVLRDHNCWNNTRKKDEKWWTRMSHHELHNNHQGEKDEKGGQMVMTNKSHGELMSNHVTRYESMVLTSWASMLMLDLRVATGNWNLRGSSKQDKRAKFIPCPEWWIRRYMSRRNFLVIYVCVWFTCDEQRWKNWIRMVTPTTKTGCSNSKGYRMWTNVL